MQQRELDRLVRLDASPIGQAVPDEQRLPPSVQLIL